MLKRLFLGLFIILSATPLFGAEPIGQVVDFKGIATITTSGQKPVQASFKQPIYLNDVLETKNEAAIKVMFIDDTLLTVKENTKTLLTEFLYHPEAKERKAVFNVLTGKVRTIVSRFFGTDQQIKIKTPNAVAGIRGTDVGATIFVQKTTFYCFDGVFDVTSKGKPGEVMQVSAGKAVEIIENKPPVEFQIPSDVIKNKTPLFDITSNVEPGSQGESGVDTVAEKTIGEATGEDMKSNDGKTTKRGNLLNNTNMFNAQGGATGTPSSDPASGILPNPGGTSDNTLSVPITITIPSS
ncbi:MAG: FecR family protein [Deltaproteobacteria bacterium]|nr:FecR family protein [Deltaproteobacteria bacterium]